MLHVTYLTTTSQNNFY